MQHLRILPLLASGTEIVHALGLGEFQVGRSHECDYPSRVTSLPVCTRPAIAVNGSSADIDWSVKNRLANALSLYEIDSDLIASLRPTHVITQTQCEVCAVSLKDVELAFQQRTSSNAQVISLSPYVLGDLWRDIESVASACDHSEAGTRLVKQLQREVSDIGARAERACGRPTVAAIEWLEPLMAAGNWVPELIEIARGTNLFGKAGEHSPWMEWSDLRASDPDILVAMPCGFDIAKTRVEMHWLTAGEGWQSLSAVRKGRVFLCDGNQYMNRSGPRLVDSLRIFAEIFHPDLFSARFEDSGWQHF